MGMVVAGGTWGGAAGTARSGRTARALGVLSVMGLIAATPTAAQYASIASVTHEAFDGARSADVVTRAEAERAAAGNVGDALEEAEGLVVQRTASGSAAPIVRGLTGNRVLLVLDGMRLNDSLMRAGGHALLNLIDPESVARIEVLRGPASVRYGSDAMGGVVRVVSEGTGVSPASRPHASAAAAMRAASAEQASRGQVMAGGVAGPFGLRVSGGLGHAGQIVAGGARGEQPFTGHDEYSFASRLEAMPARAHRVSIAHQSGHLRHMPRSDVSSPEDVRSTQALDRDMVVLDYQGQVPARDTRLFAQVGMSVRREWRRRRRERGLSDERDRVLSYQARAGVDLAAWGDARLELGGELVVEAIASGESETDSMSGVVTRGRGRYVDGSRYQMYAGYGLLSQPLAPWLSATLGLRATAVRVSAPGDPLFSELPGANDRLRRTLGGAVGSAGVKLRLSRDWAVHVNALSGFRAPNLEDFQAYGGGARGFSVPGTTLDEERSYTAEVGLKGGDEGLRLSAFAWASLLDGEIVRAPARFNGLDTVDGERVIQRQNASHSKLLGTELSLSGRVARHITYGASAFAAIGWTRRPDEEEDGRPLREPASKVPPPQARLWFGYMPRSEPYWARLLWTGRLPQPRLSAADLTDVRLCDDPLSCRQVDGFMEVTLRAGLALADHITLTLALENLFDARYRTFASGAYAPGRNLIASLRLTN